MTESVGSKESFDLVKNFRFFFGHSYVENSILDEVSSRYPEYEASTKELEFGKECITKRCQSSIFGAGIGILGAGGMLFLARKRKGKLWMVIKGIGALALPSIGMMTGSAASLSDSMEAWSVMDKENNEGVRTPTAPISFMAEFVRESSVQAIGKPSVYPCLSKKELDKEYQKIVERNRQARLNKMQ